MFNAHLTIRNEQGVPTPYLAEAVPRLNTDTWRVNPDGTMETMYRLRPDTVWHDGQPLTADDFVFSHEVYSNPDFALNTSPPTSLIDRVTAPDERTVVLHWKTTYPEADALPSTGSGGGGGSNNTALPPLPRHLLANLYATVDADGFIATEFWTHGYVGAGPYRIEKWEPGAFLEGVAFDQHVLGKPQITRIRELFIADPNTVIANLLAGQAHLTTGDSIRFTDGETLRQQWADRGQVINSYNLFRMTQFQRRPEFASTTAFTDIRVRKALHHGVDFDILNEAIQGGRTRPAYGPIPPSKSYYSQLEQAIEKYPYDPRRTEQLMTEAGFSKGADGIWIHADSRLGRMAFENNVLANPDSNAELSIMADTWRKLGFEIREVTWAPQIGADREARNSFPGLSTTSTPLGERALIEYRTDEVPTQQNRWNGSNRGAWPGTAEYDRLAGLFSTSLDQGERTQAVIQMSRILSQDVVVINLYWKLAAEAFVNGLTGPRVTDPDGADNWNLHEWTFR
jgi:peptide/nickel transport system substrate-binding protein